MKKTLWKAPAMLAAIALGVVGSLAVGSATIAAASGAAQANALPAGMLDKAWHLNTYLIGRAAPRDVSQFGSTIRFAADGQASGSGGCNTFSGTYQTGADSALTFGPLISTQIACPGDVMPWESTYFEALQSVESYSFNGAQLQLTFSNGQGTLTYTSEGQQAMVTGTVSYLQRIALTPDAVVTVRLEDQSIADASAETISEQTITNPGQVPIPFSLSYDPAKIIPTNTYAVRAEISDGGRVMFRTTTAYLVITQGHPTHVDLVLEMVSQMPATPPAGSAPSLAGTSWVLIELAAQRAAPRPAVGAQRPTLVFGTDGRVSGNTGCNSYNGPYSQEGSELSIGPLVSTLRACIDPDLAAQEQVMMAVLSDSPLDATQEGSRLTLAAPAGTLVFIKATVQNEEPVQPGMPRSGAPGPGGPVELFALAMLSIGLGLGGLRLLKSSHRDRRL